MLPLMTTGQDSQTGTPEETVSAGRVATASRGLVIGAVAATAAMWLFLWLADEVMESATQNLDARAVHYLHVHASPAVYQFMAAISQIGSPAGHTALIACAMVYCLWRRRFLLGALALLVSSIGGGILNGSLKHLYHRARPEPAFYHLGYSFPSGHAMSAIIVYGFVAYLLARGTEGRYRILIWVAAIFMTLLVGFSRVYLGVHYPSDVLGGYLAGACWLAGCILSLRLMERRLPSPSRKPPDIAIGELPPE